MSGDIQFGIKLTYDGKAVAGGAAASTQEIKQIGETAKKAGGEATQAFDRSAISAKQMSAAMRGVPAQFTDIFTSIAAGQNPMQVMLQQGGQLKDMFGGVGPAARALGGYIAGLVNPYSVAAAAAAGLAFVYHQGRAESDAYTRALILTGAAAETTAARLADTARSVARITGGTQGAAAEAMTQAASAGSIGADNLAVVAAAAVRMQLVTGKAIDDTVAEFAKLGSAPVAASLKLNEQYRYLTAATFAQIKALQEQGRTQDAAALSMQTYADAVKQRTEEIVNHLSPLEDKWWGIKAAAKGALDAVFNISRPTDPLEAAVEKVQKIQTAIRDASKPENVAYDPAGSRAELIRLNDLLVAAKANMVVVRDKARADDVAAEAKKKLNDQEQAAVKFRAEGNNYLTTKAKLDKEIERIRTEGKAGGIPQSEIETRVARASDNWNKAISGARLDAEGARLKAWHEEYRDTIKRALDESRLDYEGYWAAVMAGERLLAEDQLRMAKARSGQAAARGDAPEVIKLKGEIDALQARLKTGIAAETERGLAGDREKAKTSGDNSRLDWANADTKALTEAAAWRRQNLSLLDQELIAAREKAAADLRERQAQLTKNDALKHAPELLKQYQQAATDQSAQTLAGIEAEIRARREANAEWINGAKAASRDYVESVADSAGQAKRAWSGTWRRAEDDLTQFYMTGKLNVRGFVEYAVSELARIKLAQPLVSKLAGAADGLIDKLFPSAAAQETTAMNAWAALPNAKGNVYESPDLHQYVNSVVDRPTYFKFAKGGSFGVAGEVPGASEGIMPLKRDKQGRLGVIAEGGGGFNLTYAPVFEIDARGAGIGVGQMLQGVVDVAVNRSKSELMAELASGGQFAYATGRRRG